MSRQEMLSLFACNSSSALSFSFFSPWILMLHAIIVLATWIVACIGGEMPPVLTRLLLPRLLLPRLLLLLLCRGPDIRLTSTNTCACSLCSLARSLPALLLLMHEAACR